MPQSSITLVSGVTTTKQDLPTCLTPPRQNSITSSLLADHDGGLLDRPSVGECCCCCCVADLSAVVVVAVYGEVVVFIPVDVTNYKRFSEYAFA